MAAARRAAPAPRSTPALWEAQGEAHRALQRWAPSPAGEPPVSIEDAEALAEIGEAERRVEPEQAIGAARRIVRSYPQLLSKSDDEVVGYVAEMAEVLARHHPDVVASVTSGGARIQLRSKFAPSVAEVAEALRAAAAARFAVTQRARLALAHHAARAVTGAVKSPELHQAFRLKDGDGALRVVAQLAEGVA